MKIVLSFSTIAIAILSESGCMPRSRKSMIKSQLENSSMSEQPVLDKYEDGGRTLYRTPAEKRHWGYVSQTENADTNNSNIIPPNQWHEQYETCASKLRQSPINLPPSNIFQRRVSTDRVNFDWASGESIFAFVNNRHAIQGSVTDATAKYQISVGDHTYALRQFHYHRNSEHMMNHSPLDYEIHFVHENTSTPGDFAVVGIFAKKTTFPKATPLGVFVSRLLNMAPARTEDDRYKPTPVLTPMTSFLPREFKGQGPYPFSYYKYRGSLTTPPCTESVTWIVLADPIEIAAGQIEAIQKARFNITFDNARPAFEPNDQHKVEFHSELPSR